MNKQEIKYQYTASLMDEAFLLLLEQKEYDAITVKEVCQKAGVNRSTFYLHYETMNDLLEETVALINDRFKASLASVPTDDPTKVVLTSEQYLRPYLSFIKENMLTLSAVTSAVIMLAVLVLSVAAIRKGIVGLKKCGSNIGTQ